MKGFAQLGVPNNFDELLPELKAKNLKWETIYNSGSAINSSAKISFCHPISGTACGSIILIPGLGTNFDIDPLMKPVTFWALHHKYNVVTIDTFINDFLTELSPEKIKLNTYTEFKTIIHQSLKFLHPYIIDTPSVLIGHCASANGIIDTFNNCVKQKEPILVTSAMLFAPWPKNPGDSYEDAMTRMMKKEIAKYPQTKAIDAVSKIKLAHMLFLSAMSDFMKEVENSKFEPDLMAQWNIPVTLIAAQRDKLSRPSRIEQNYKILSIKSDKFNYLCLPNKKHTFEKLYEDTNAVINLIKSQKLNIK